MIVTATPKTGVAGDYVKQTTFLKRDSVIMTMFLCRFAFCLIVFVLLTPLNALCQTSARANTESASAPGPPTLDRYGNLFISPPTRQLTIADLVGNWGDNPGRIATTYVYKSGGAHAGTDSLHYTSKSTIDADG